MTNNYACLPLPEEMQQIPLPSTAAVQKVISTSLQLLQQRGLKPGAWRWHIQALSLQLLQVTLHLAQSPQQRLLLVPICPKNYR